MTPTVLIMIGPGKLMVGHRPYSRPGSGYATPLEIMKIMEVISSEFFHVYDIFIFKS